MSGRLFQKMKTIATGRGARAAMQMTEPAWQLILSHFKLLATDITIIDPMAVGDLASAAVVFDWHYIGLPLPLPLLHSISWSPLYSLVYSLV